MSLDSVAEPPVSDLISVAQAIKIIDHEPVVPRAVQVNLAESQGLRLAEAILSDREYPPFRKSLMDGYAVRCEDVSHAPADLACVAEVAAGQTPTRAVAPGEAIAIMTGAPLPAGADGVVPVEDVEARARVGQTVRVLRAPTPGRYIAERGSDCAAGKIVLPVGALMGPAQMAVAASVGASQINVFARPRVAVLGTGDELVDTGAAPGDSQIRNSNNPMLVGLLRQLGCDVQDLGFVRDEPLLICAAIQHGLGYDALFITGGMSMGEYDFVPKLLIELGVTLKITKLKIKPGKPFVFGVGEGSGFGVRGSGEEDPQTRGQGREATRRRGDTETRRQEDVESSGPEVSPAQASIPASPRPPFPASSLLSPQSSVLSPAFVFGLPGNPVSAFVCTLRLASRLLARMAGGAVEERWVHGRMEMGLPANGPREFYQPAVRTVAPGTHSGRSEFAAIVPLGWKGSADLFTLARANVLLVRGENEPPVPKGTVVRVLEI